MLPSSAAFAECEHRERHRVVEIQIDTVNFLCKDETRYSQPRVKWIGSELLGVSVYFHQQHQIAAMNAIQVFVTTSASQCSSSSAPLIQSS